MRNAWRAAVVAWTILANTGEAEVPLFAPSDSSLSGLRFANQVVRDTGEDSSAGGELADVLEPPAAPGLSVPAILDDIALFSSKTVTLHGLDLVIRNRKRGRLMVVVHDVSGREVLSGDYGPGRELVLVPLDRIPRGTYVCSVRLTDSVYVRTIVLTR